MNLCGGLVFTFTYKLIGTHNFSKALQCLLRQVHVCGVRSVHLKPWGLLLALKRLTIILTKHIYFLQDSQHRAVPLPGIQHGSEVRLDVSASTSPSYNTVHILDSCFAYLSLLPAYGFNLYLSSAPFQKSLSQSGTTISKISELKR